MPITNDVYEARYGWSRRNVILFAACLVFTGGVFLLDPSGTAHKFGIPIPMIVIQVLGLALFGGGALLTAYNSATKKVALRVDSSGILLGGTPLRYTNTTALVPWSEVTGVELWIHSVRAGHRTVKTPYVGVHRAPGARALPKVGAGASLAGVSRELLNGSRPVTGWPLDTARLLDAVRRHAPEAALIVAPDYPANH